MLSSWSATVLADNIATRLVRGHAHEHRIASPDTTPSIHFLAIRVVLRGNWAAHWRVPLASIYAWVCDSWARSLSAGVKLAIWSLSRLELTLNMSSACLWVSWVSYMIAVVVRTSGGVIQAISWRGWRVIANFHNFLIKYYNYGYSNDAECVLTFQRDNLLL